MNVTTDTDWSTVVTIENSYNDARRQEEMQLGLPANSIANLDLPGQNTWNAYSVDQKALYVINNERTSRAGINYGTGPVKGLPFNGIEAKIDQVAQNWSQYLVDNNITGHCLPTPNDCPGGRINAAYPAGCTETGGFSENLWYHSSGTVPLNDAVVSSIFGWIYRDAIGQWGHRHAMLSQSYNDNYGAAMQEGFIGFGIAQTTNTAVTWKTVVTINFTDPVSDAASTNCGYNVTVTTNSLIPVPCTLPVINSVVSTQPPNCNNQTGSITVNASGTGTLEYSANDGVTWQASNIFNNLGPDNYNIVVRFIDKLDCPTNYAQNPVVINEVAGCNTCTLVASTDVPKNLMEYNTATSTINIPTNGVITDVNVKNVTGTHTYVRDLTFSLVSPQNTTVILLAKKCGDADNFSISFDDQGAPAFVCPMNDGMTKKPENSLSVFNGQNAMGTWTLRVLDDGNGDVGSLTGWSLEVCVPTVQCTPPTINSVVLTQPTCTPQSGVITINATGSSTLEYSINNGANWQIGNVFNNLTPGNYLVVVRLQADPSCLTNHNANPITLNAATNCAPCLSFNATDLPKAINENLPTTSSTVSFTTAGTITDVNVKNVNGNHPYVGDLTFTLVSPQNTMVVLLAKQCTSADNFNISFDDQAATAFACPMNDGQTRQPANALSAFTGQNPQGNWTLQILDDGQGDVGTLNGWTLEVCVQTAQCTPPTITSVASSQPTCETQTATVTVNANGAGTLEYSADNGTNWQASNIFNNRPPGQYPVVVRLQSNTACMANYNQNPIAIIAADNCNNCLEFVAADVPMAINDNTTITSSINVTRQGTITDVNIKNVTGTHTYVGDLTFTLISPQNTTVVLLTKQCTSADDFNISFSDLGTAFVCPINDNQTRLPENTLAVLKGQSSVSIWKLQVQDDGIGDSGSLTGWTLELCGNFTAANCPANLNVDNAPMVNNGFFQAEIQVTCASTVPAGNNVTFQAGNNCELRPNFAVETNATLEVRIGACTN